MKWIIVVFMLAIACGAESDPYESNPFYVDPATVKKEQTKWTMHLKNHHAGAKDKANPELTLAWVEFESFDENVLHFKMNDKNGMRWEVPLLNPNSRKDYKPAPMTEMGFDFQQDPFSFSIKSPKSGDLLVSTHKDSFGSLKYFDKFIEMGLWYPSNKIFGLGERVTSEFALCAKRQDCVYTMFNKDEVSPLDTGEPPGGKNIYGSQPFYLIQTKKGSFFGVLWYNLNDQDIVIVKREGGYANVYHKTIGGIIDMYFFYSGTAEFILKKYHSYIGRPYLPPFWTLGFHLCRYGWPNLSKVKDVVAKMEIADIPLDTVWADIDYMKDYADFTIDQDRYGGMGDFVDDLHKRKMHWVPIIDAGLKYDLNDPYYKKGVANNAFIKSAWSRQTLVGKVWPGLAVFPDWNTPYMTELWQEGLGNLFKMAEFDGIWIDMNDVSNFCNGECPPKESLEEKRMLRERVGEDPHDPHEFDNLPYYPGYKDPAEKALSMTGYHRATNEYEERFHKEYNLHNLFCLYEAQATHKFFTEVQKKRAFVLTRSQVPGSGMFTSLWLGDNFSRWEYMRYSINGMYSYQMFGMPLVGADICGFIDNTTEELCARWMQMGAFYPFSRNHNDIHAMDQEPYIWNKVATAGRNAIRQKYSLLMYYYTKLFEVSLYGGTLARPLFFEFPNDPKAYEKTEFTFMIGPALLIAPVLHEGIYSSFPYVPNENWYDMFWRVRQYTYVEGKNEGKELVLPGGYEYVNVLLRGGNIVPFQEALGAKVRRTSALKYMPMELVIGPDHLGEATGSLIVDYEDSLNSIEKKEYRHLTFAFSFTEQKMKVNVVNDYDKFYPFEKFAKMAVLGAEKWSRYRYACVMTKDKKRLPVSTSYNEGQGALYISTALSVYWSEIDYVDFSQSC